MNNTKNTVYISNLSYSSDRQVLKSMFMRFGHIKNIKIIVEPSTNQSRGMAFVEMASSAEAQAAIGGLNGKVFSGRTIKARAATPLRAIAAPRYVGTSKNADKDLDFTSIQVAKKARNDKKRKSNPLVYKYVPAKKSE